MCQKNEVTEFVREVFDLYEIPDGDFFSSFDEKTFGRIPCELFRGAEVDEDTLQKLSVELGLTTKEILDMDMKAAKKYWDKYPFFHIYKEYLEIIDFHNDHPIKTMTAEERRGNKNDH